jgi:hypothetical protein
VALAESELPQTVLPIATLGRAAATALARLFVVLSGLVAIAWGASTLPMFWREATLERIAGRIIDRDVFKPGALEPLLPEVAAAEQARTCRPEALRSAAIIRMRMAESAMAAGERQEIDGRLSSLQDTIRRSLACSPADPFLWMVLAWVEGAREGFRLEQLQYLRLSYRLGPNEGWVAARRNRLALATFERLPPDLADAAVNEFAHMVDSWIYGETLAIFTGPGWPIRDRLLASLKDIGERQREAFAKALYAQGYDIKVPGITPRDPRPWY